MTFKSIKVKNLPYKVSVSDAKGHPVTVRGRSKSKPIRVTVTVSFLGAGNPSPAPIRREEASREHASNKGSKITFSKQKFSKAGGERGCPASASFSATFGPVVDSSVKGSPKVFVN